MTSAPVVLAHQGGWDELLMVLVPILIFAALLVVANRRASRIGEQQSLAAPGGATPDGHGPIPDAAAGGAGPAGARPESGERDGRPSDGRSSP